MENKPKKPQTMRYSDDELRMIKLNFAENESLLLLMRKAMFQFPMTVEERELLANQFSSEEINKLMRKTFLPEIQENIPIGQSIDLWMTVEMRDKDPQRVMVDLLVRKRLIERLETGLECLKGVVPVDFDPIVKYSPNIVMSESFDEYVKVNSRNTYISHIEQQLIQLKLLAGLKDETIEESKERLKKDSAKQVH